MLLRLRTLIEVKRAGHEDADDGHGDGDLDQCDAQLAGRRL
jgi:hypothetical protein